MNTVSPEKLKELIQTHIPDANISISTYSGDDHFEALIISSSFEGKSKVQRQKMIFTALGDKIHNEIHALTLKTLTPEERQTQPTAS